MVSLGGTTRSINRPGLRVRLVWCAVVVTALLSGACASNDESDASGEATPLVVDTDMGPDDVRALMMVATDPSIDLLAVTVSGTGLARCPTGAANTRAILDALGRNDVPVACGTGAPIEGSNLAPTAWRDAADALVGMPRSDPAGIDADGAVDLLTATIQSSTEPVALLTLGPLTNVAAALTETPSLADGVERIVAMAGAFDVGGNTLSFTSPPLAELNVWFDPVAFDIVLASGADLTLVPLDATNDVPVTPMLYASFDRLGDDAPEAGRLLAAHLDLSPLTGGLYHWDDLAAAVVTRPDLITTEERRVVVSTDPGPANGATTTEARGRPAQVAVGADRRAFEQYFADVFGLDGLDTSSYVADATVEFDGDRCTYRGPDPLPQELVIEVVNTSDRSALGVSAGVYDSDATADDLATYWASQPTAPPYFLTISSIAPLRAGTTSYWRFENPENTTLSCAYDLASGVELAGPRLGPVDD